MRVPALTLSPSRHQQHDYQHQHQPAENGRRSAALPPSAGHNHHHPHPVLPHFTTYAAPTEMMSPPMPSYWRPISSRGPPTTPSSPPAAGADEGRRSETAGCQLQACNLLLALLGAAGLALAGTQFQPRMGIDNYRQIDLRLAIAWLYTLTGTVGFYCVGRSHGSIVIKTLYSLSAVLAIGSAIFYGFTTYKVNELHQQLIRFEHQGGQFTGAFGVARTSADFVPKTVISASMVALSSLAALVSLISLGLLDRLAVVERPWYPAQREDQIRVKFTRSLLAGAAIAKLLTGLASLALAVFVELQHNRLALRQDYYRIVLDQLSALVAVASAVADLYALYNRMHNSLNMKVSIALSVVAAIWCLKSVDNNAFPFYKQDINVYRVAVSATQNNGVFSSVGSAQHTIVLAHAILLALLCLLAFVCACTSILAAACLRECISKPQELLDLGVQNKCLCLLHCFWAVCLLCLVLLGLTDLPWSGDFIGGDLLWLAALLFATGVLRSSNERNSTTLKFTLSVLCLALCAEKALLSVWLLFQSVTHPDYTNEAVFDRRSRIGQIVLHGAQCFVLTCEAITAFCGTMVYGRAIGTRSSWARHYSAALHCLCSLGALFYSVAFLSSQVFFELNKWRWSEVLVEQTQHYRLGNGLLGLAVFVVQLVGCWRPQFLVAAALLQLVLSSIALFTMNSAITNTYYLQILFNARSAIGMSANQRILHILGICFAGAATIACALQLLCGIVCILRSSFLLHHFRPRSPLESPSGAGITVTSYYAGSPVDDGGEEEACWYSQPSAALHQFAIQPIEEQTLYWSAEENPYIYKSTKRIYGQPILGVEKAQAQHNSGGRRSAEESDGGRSPYGKNSGRCQPMGHQHYQREIVIGDNGSEKTTTNANTRRMAGRRKAGR